MITIIRRINNNNVVDKISYKHLFDNLYNDDVDTSSESSNKEEEEEEKREKREKRENRKRILNSVFINY